MRALKPEWLPDCRMKRIITHWTAGAHKASALDKEHYHFLIEGDATVVKGDHSVKDNVSSADGHYAAHTLGCNSGSIGVSACCMAGARQSPFHQGSHPMRLEQWKRMAEVCAELCEFYDIPVTPQTVLGHGEVQLNMGCKQRGKWDPLVLPWDPGKSVKQVGEMFRDEVRRALGDAPPPPAEKPPKVTVEIAGKIYSGMLEDGTSFVPLRAVADDLGWRIIKAEGEKATVKAGGELFEIDFFNHEGTGYAECRDVAQILGKPIDWEPAAKKVVIG